MNLIKEGDRSNSPTFNSEINEASSSSIKKTSFSRTVMKWTDEKDVILCKEVALQNPFQFRKGSLERGKVWSGVAKALQKQFFKVDQRAVRDRYNSLQAKMKKINAQDKRASGISPEVSECQKELTSLLEDLGNQEEDAELLPITPTDEEQKRLDGQEVQKRACESFAESRKRLFTDKENTPLQPSKKRNSGSDTLSFLSKKVELEREIRKEELSIRRAELERREREEERRRFEEAERERRFELYQQQQQQMQQQLLQHQQQMQHMMLMLMQTLKGDNSKN